MLAGAVVACAVLLLVYSQTRAMGWDEGFHLLAARLIVAGEWPYRDFVFGQTPLGAWWNALLMMAAGIGWRGPHAAAALESAGAVWLVADYVWRRSPEPSRFAMAMTAAALTGLNQLIVNYATMGQAYALCSLLGIAAFRCAVESRAFLSGLLAGMAAAASLLMAPLGLVLFIRHLRNGLWRFAAGALLGFAPVFWYLVRTPHEFLFDVVQFHIYYRSEDWGNWFSHDLEVISGWLDAGQGIMIVTLAAAGAVFGRGQSQIRLCALIAIAECLFLALAHPTFAQYYTIVVPFAAILACVSLQEFYQRYPRQWPAVAVCSLMAVMLARTLAQQTGKMTWGHLESVAQSVNDVLKPSDTLYADEHIYLLTKRMPPAGMEWVGNHKIDMPLSEAHALHVLPQAELDRRVRNGEFSLFESCEEDDVQRLGVESLYAKKKQIGSCFVFHELKAR